jgi:VCBS repeat protein
VIIADRLGAPEIGVADMNGDGTPDIAVALGGPAGGVDIFVNDGHGGFATQAEFSTAPYADGVAVGDFDEDGDVDLATPAVGGFSLLPNDGRGQFSSHAEYDLGSTPRSLTALDVDGDGRPDLIADIKDGVYQVIRNEGGGRLTPEAPVEFVGRTLAWVDLTGDGLPEHIAGPLLEEVSSALTIFPNRGRTFGPGARSEPPGLMLPLGEVVAGDVNHDGRSDLLFLNRGYQDSPYAALLMADGAGAFSVDEIYAIAGYAFALGDLTGDGRLDLVVGYQDRVCVFANVNRQP